MITLEEDELDYGEDVLTDAEAEHFNVLDDQKNGNSTACYNSQENLSRGFIAVESNSLKNQSWNKASEPIFEPSKKKKLGKDGVVRLVNKNENLKSLRKKKEKKKRKKKKVLGKEGNQNGRNCDQQWYPWMPSVKRHISNYYSNDSKSAKLPHLMELSNPFVPDSQLILPLMQIPNLLQPNVVYQNQNKNLGTGDPIATAVEKLVKSLIGGLHMKGATSFLHNSFMNTKDDKNEFININSSQNGSLSGRPRLNYNNRTQNIFQPYYQHNDKLFSGNQYDVGNFHHQGNYYGINYNTNHVRSNASDEKKTYEFENRSSRDKINKKRRNACSCFKSKNYCCCGKDNNMIARKIARGRRFAHEVATSDLNKKVNKNNNDICDSMQLDEEYMKGIEEQKKRREEIMRRKILGMVSGQKGCIDNEEKNFSSGCENLESVGISLTRARVDLEDSVLKPYILKKDNILDSKGLCVFNGNIGNGDQEDKTSQAGKPLNVDKILELKNICSEKVNHEDERFSCSEDKTVKICNLPPNTTKRDLTLLCVPVGKPLEIKLNFPKENSATIRFQEASNAETFCILLHGREIDDFILNVTVI